jgi:hypothetical protein
VVRPKSRQFLDSRKETQSSGIIHLDTIMAVSDGALYRSCIEVLGNARDHISFQRLVEILKQEPVLGLENGHVIYYYFHDYGIGLIYKKSHQSFAVAVFFVDSPNVKRGERQRYKGEFQSSVTPDDSMLQIEGKITSVPIDRYRNSDGSGSGLHYEFQDHLVTFHFDGPGQHLQLASVQLKRELKKARAILG